MQQTAERQSVISIHPSRVALQGEASGQTSGRAQGQLSEDRQPTGETPPSKMRPVAPLERAALERTTATHWTERGAGVASDRLKLCRFKSAREPVASQPRAAYLPRFEMPPHTPNSVSTFDGVCASRAYCRSRQVHVASTHISPRLVSGTALAPALQPCCCEFATHHSLHSTPAIIGCLQRLLPAGRAIWPWIAVWRLVHAGRTRPPAAVLAGPPGCIGRLSLTVRRCEGCRLCPRRQCAVRFELSSEPA